MSKYAEDMIGSKFSLECQKIELRRSGSNEIAYAGPGRILQGKNNFELTVYSAVEKDFDEFAMFLQNGSPGQLVSESHYYSLIATDYQNRVWTSSKVDVIDLDVSLSAERVVGRFWELEKVIPLSVEKCYITAWTLGRSHVAFNEFVDRDNRSSLSLLKFKAFGMEYSIEDFESHTLFSISSERYVSEVYMLAFLEAVSIWSGTLLRPMVRQEIGGGRKRDVLWARGVVEGKLGSFKVFNHPNGCSDDIAFIKCYIKEFAGLDNHCFAYWYKILASSMAPDFEIRSLVLSIGVEGLVKRYFRDVFCLDKDVKVEIGNAKRAVDEVFVINKKVKDRVVNALDGMEKVSVRNVLLFFAGKGVFDKGAVQSWYELRNAKAHADLLDVSEYQKEFDRYHAALDIFYSLIVMMIAYRGAYARYSQPGWPVKAVVGVSGLYKFRGLKIKYKLISKERYNRADSKGRGYCRTLQVVRNGGYVWRQLSTDF